MNLNKMVTIQKRGQTQDSAGQRRDTWQKVADVWASVRPVSGRNFFAASGERADVSHEIILRHGPTVKAGDRIMLGARTFEVVRPFNVDERDRYLKLMATENAAAA